MKTHSLTALNAACETFRRQCDALAAARQTFNVQLAESREKLPELLALVQRVQGLTSRQIAQDLGVTEGYLSSIRTGRITSKVSAELIEKLGALLGS